MAQTNKQIIAMYKAENGITEALNTYSYWKSQGYRVKRGEHSEHRITIWKKVNYQKENERGETETKSRMILKEAAFFTREQVEKIEG